MVGSRLDRAFLVSLSHCPICLSQEAILCGKCSLTESHTSFALEDTPNGISRQVDGTKPLFTEF